MMHRPTEKVIATYRLRAVPGGDKFLALGLLDEIHAWRTNTAQGGDSTSIRVWCSHVGWPLHMEITSGHEANC
jgi:hypothetical protein